MTEIQNLEQKIQLAQFYDDEYGFAAFYELLFGRELPHHAFGWIRDIYQSQRAGRGRIIEAFRGSTKTTTITIAFNTFQIGHNPWDSNVFIQASDESAEKKAQEVAGLIQDNPGFKSAFPWVKPDPDVSWAARGYEVLSEMVKVPDDSPERFHYEPIDYENFRRLKASVTQDPSFIGLGVGSTAIIGKHPTGVLDLDDIHDEKNTRSPRELLAVKDTLEATILPTTTTPTGGTRFRIVIGTPWKYDDAFAAMKKKPGYDHSFTPIMVDNKPVWESSFPKERIEELRQNTTEIEFARMYLLDLTAAEGVHLKREWLEPDYPFELIKPNWHVYFGVDYASTADKFQKSGKERDFFTIAKVVEVPGGGGAILVDGFKGHVSQGEAEQKLKSWAAAEPYLKLIGVESLGKGEEFFHLLLRNTNLPIIEKKTNKGKGERFEQQMAPLFEFGRVKLSSLHTKFIDEFISEWIRFPEGTHDDCLDAVYWALNTMKFSLYQTPDKYEMGLTNPRFKERQKNPAMAFMRK